jgi:N-acylglucosamine 2-epimerase
MNPKILSDLYKVYDHELLERVIPFWQKHSLDTNHGGYFNCLDADGSIYDRTKHIWLQGRQVWMFSKLYNTENKNPAWLQMAKSGAEFLRRHAILPDGKVLFALTEEGKPLQYQRKMYSACFVALGFSEYGRASGDQWYLEKAQELLGQIWRWAFHPEDLRGPSFSGETPSQTLAVPMILLNLFEEVCGSDISKWSKEIETCISEMLEHVNYEQRMVFENVGPKGQVLDSPQGRLLNPGHAIEGSWFLMHWAKRLGRPELKQHALNMARWSHETGWDKEKGGLFYFLDAKGYSPLPLEWNMKLWWPHCEALYAHLLNFKESGDTKDWDLFMQTHEYTFSHFPDPKYGEWFGYLDRNGEVTHRFKGGPYKGCFHVPRALWLVKGLLKEMSR